MRLNRLLYFLYFLLAIPACGFGQTIPIAPSMLLDIGGQGANCISTGMKLDAQDNIYVMGIFSGTVDFDPSARVTNLTSVGEFDGYIAKYSASGALVWAKSFGGDRMDQPNSLDIDDNGNITLIGQFNSRLMDADPGPGVFNFSASDRDAFILHLDNNGNFLWAKSIGSNGNESGNQVASDSFGNLTAAYWFQGSVNVDESVTAKGVTDGLVVKYDPNGNVIWKFSLGVSGGGDNSVTGSLVDKDGNIIIAGYTSGTVNYNPLGTPENVTANNAMFLAQYSPDGILQWIKTINGDRSDYNISLVIDSEANIYMNGLFTGELDFGVAPTLTVKGRQDVFFAKYSSDGNLLYHKSIGGTNAFINNYGMVVGPDNNLYLSGYFERQVDFDPSASEANVVFRGIRDMFLVKYDDGGNYQWAFSMGNNCNQNFARYITVTSNNDILLTGSFCSTVNFSGLDCGTAKMTSISGRDMFIVRYTANTTTPISNNIIAAPSVKSGCIDYDPAPITGGTPAGSTGNYTYQWQQATDNRTFTDIAGAVLKDFDPPVITVTTFYRRMVSGDCSISNVVQLTVNILPDNTIVTPPVPSFCTIGDATVITGSAPPLGSGVVYQWQQSADNVTFININGATARDYDPEAAGTTTYYRRVLTSALCNIPTISNTVTITVISFTVSADQTVCLGDSVTLNATGGTRYSWSPAIGLSATNIASPTATPTVATTYTVMFFNGSCSSTLSVKVDVVAPPLVNAGPDKTIIRGAMAQMAGQVTAAPGTTYQWSPATYLDNPNSLTPVATPAQSITYRLTAKTPKGCFVVSDDVSVTLVEKIIIPNTFTPNGDGINDVLAIDGLDSYKQSVFTIFDRNGQQVFKSLAYPKPWDGTRNGKPLPIGTYYYVIELNNGPKRLSGYINVLK
jgi:gliding motility-associated-like protein